MKIPSKLKIGGHTFKVEMCSLDSATGQTDTQKNLIKIDPDYPKDQIEATLINEIFHCLNSTISHTLLDSLSEQFYQALKDNNLLK